jgi:pyrroloquinoline quinone biosynthesis protein D
MTPRLARGVRLRPDPRDGTPVLLSPERGLRLGGTAATIVQLCDGVRGLDAIVDVLAGRYAGAERARIDGDVRALLRELRSRGLVEGVDAVGSPAGGMLAAGLASESAASAGPSAAPYTLVAELTRRCALACP